MFLLHKKMLHVVSDKAETLTYKSALPSSELVKQHPLRRQQ